MKKLIKINELKLNPMSFFVSTSHLYSVDKLGATLHKVHAFVGESKLFRSDSKVIHRLIHTS